MWSLSFSDSKENNNLRVKSPSTPLSFIYYLFCSLYISYKLPLFTRISSTMVQSPEYLSLQIPLVLYTRFWFFNRYTFRHRCPLPCEVHFQTGQFIIILHPMLPSWHSTLEPLLRVPLRWGLIQTVVFQEPNITLSLTLTKDFTSPHFIQLNVNYNRDWWFPKEIFQKSNVPKYKIK